MLFTTTTILLFILIHFCCFWDIFLALKIPYNVFQSHFYNPITSPTHPIFLPFQLCTFPLLQLVPPYTLGWVDSHWNMVDLPVLSQQIANSNSSLARPICIPSSCWDIFLVVIRQVLCMLSYYWEFICLAVLSCTTVFHYIYPTLVLRLLFSLPQ